MRKIYVVVVLMLLFSTSPSDNVRADWWKDTFGKPEFTKLPARDIVKIRNLTTEDMIFSVGHGYGTITGWHKLPAGGSTDTRLVPGRFYVHARNAANKPIKFNSQVTSNVPVHGSKFALEIKPDGTVRTYISDQDKGSYTKENLRKLGFYPQKFYEYPTSIGEFKITSALPEEQGKPVPQAGGVIPGGVVNPPLPLAFKGEVQPPNFGQPQLTIRFADGRATIFIIRQPDGTWNVHEGGTTINMIQAYNDGSLIVLKKPYSSTTLRLDGGNVTAVSGNGIQTFIGAGQW